MKNYNKENNLKTETLQTIKEKNMKEEDQRLAKEWHSIDWAQVNQEVNAIQERIVEAAQGKNWSMTYKLQRELVCSYSGRAKAVRKVVSNTGGKTASPCPK